MIESNLFEVLAVAVFGGYPLLALTIGLLFRHVIDAQRLRHVNRDQFMEYEYSFAFLFAWYGGMIMLSIFGPLFWIDIWEAPNTVESAVYIFVLWMLLLLVKWCWFTSLYVQQTTSMARVKFYIIVDVCIAIAYSLLIILTLHLADRPWYHWLVLLTIIHPAFEWVAMLNANKYREQEISLDENSTSIFNSGTDVALHPSKALYNAITAHNNPSSNP